MSRPSQSHCDIVSLPFGLLFEKAGHTKDSAGSLGRGGSPTSTGLHPHRSYISPYSDGVGLRGVWFSPMPVISKENQNENVGEKGVWNQDRG